MNNKAILVIIVVLLIAGAIFWSTQNNDTTAIDTATSTVSTTTDVSGSTEGPNALIVADQRPGNEVRIDMVKLGVDGYVQVHEVTADGKPGAGIGVSDLLDQGEDEDVIVKLTRSSRDGEKLIAMLHQDNGNGKFEVAADKELMDSQGNVIMKQISISRTAPEDIEVEN